MTGGEREKWDARHREADGPGEPARVLCENLHLLPPSGRALDLACGLGANALLLAARGLDVHAWDLSPVAIGRLRGEADRRGLTIRVEVRDVVKQPPEPAGFDVLVVSRFLERSLAPCLAAALRPEGLLFYQTFTRTRVSDTGPKNPAYRLDDNELLALFPSLRVLVYREEGRVGEVSRGFRDEAMLVARKEGG